MIVFSSALRKEIYRFQLLLYEFNLVDLHMIYYSKLANYGLLLDTTDKKRLPVISG